MARIKFMTIEIDNLSMREAVNKIDDLIQQERPSFVVTPNVDHLVQIERGGALKEAYDKADLVLADGKPLIWISKWYGTPIKEKISGSDLFPHLCAMAAEKGYKMFFLGAAEGVAEKAALKLKEKFPGLQICGKYSPPYGFEKNIEEISKIKNLISESKPDILIVCFGCPKQELFMCKYKDELGVPVSLGLGATLDFESGMIKRAPAWVSNAGFEWLYRIFCDPVRMIKRYLIDDFKIFGMIMKYRKTGK